MKGKKILSYLKTIGGFVVAAFLVWVGLNVYSFFHVPTKAEVDSSSNGSNDLSKSDLSAWDFAKLYLSSLNIFKKM